MSRRKRRAASRYRRPRIHTLSSSVAKRKACSSLVLMVLQCSAELCYAVHLCTPAFLVQCWDSTGLAWRGVAFGAPRFPGEVERSALPARESRFPPLGRAEILQPSNFQGNWPTGDSSCLTAAPTTGNEDSGSRERMNQKQTPLLCSALHCTAILTVRACVRTNAVDAKGLSRNRMEESCNTHNSSSRLAHQVGGFAQ